MTCVAAPTAVLTHGTGIALDRDLSVLSESLAVPRRYGVADFA
jgi:hypothetical protein